MKSFLGNEYNNYFVHASNDSESITNPAHHQQFLHYVTISSDQQFHNNVFYIANKEKHAYSLLRHFMSAWSSDNIAFHQYVTLDFRLHPMFILRQNFLATSLGPSTWLYAPITGYIDIGLVATSVSY